MAWTTTDKYWGEKLKIAEQKTEQAEAEKAQLQLMISGGGNRPGEDAPYRPPDPKEVPGVPPGYPHIPKMLAHGEGRGPQPKYHDEYNRPLKIPPWMQMNPSGELIEIPWMKEKYLNEHPEIADHRGLTNYLDSKGRSGRTGSFKDSGLSQDKLIEALKIGLQVMKA